MSYSVEGVADKPKSKEERIKELIKSLDALDQAIQPFKEQKSDLKKSYVENTWLSKEEMKYIIKAYSLAKKGDFDLDMFIEAFNKIK
jgi:molecular chaperone GrpE (heat shock protein)